MPAGDQPEAIAKLSDGFLRGLKSHVGGGDRLGKTFTMAKL